MKFSAKAKYALKLLVDLAEHQNNGYISLSDISERQNISKKYLEQIVPMLVKSGILRTNRGNKGGYMLNISPYGCTVGDILRATEGELIPVENPQYESDKPVAFVWEEIHNVMEKCIDSISVQDIIERQKDYFYYCI